MFTWSFGCAPEIVAMTSLEFMFDDVPEPVWKTSIGNCASCLPSAISSPAAAIFSASSASSSPSSAFTRAAVPLMRPSQRTTGSGTRSPDTGKFATAFVVSPPHSSVGVSCTLIGLLRVIKFGVPPNASDRTIWRNVRLKFPRRHAIISEECLSIPRRSDAAAG